jgi:hypothetical protein
MAIIILHACMPLRRLTAREDGPAHRRRNGLPGTRARPRPRPPPPLSVAPSPRYSSALRSSPPLAELVDTRGARCSPSDGRHPGRSASSTRSHQRCPERKRLACCTDRPMSAVLWVLAPSGLSRLAEPLAPPLFISSFVWTRRWRSAWYHRGLGLGWGLPGAAQRASGGAGLQLPGALSVSSVTALFGHQRELMKAVHASYGSHALPRKHPALSPVGCRGRRGVSALFTRPGGSSQGSTAVSRW